MILRILTINRFSIIWYPRRYDDILSGSYWFDYLNTKWLWRIKIAGLNIMYIRRKK